MITDETTNYIYDYILARIANAKDLGEKAIMYIVDITVHDVKEAVSAYHKLTDEGYSIHTSCNYGMHIVDVTWN